MGIFQRTSDLPPRQILLQARENLRATPNLNCLIITRSKDV